MLNSVQKKGILIVLLSVIFYAIIAFYSDFEQLSNSFQKIQLFYIPPILSLVILSIFLKSERQRYLLGKISIKISIKESFVIFNAGQSLLVTPGGVGSLIKSHFFKQKFDNSVPKTVAVVLVERFFDLVGIISLILIFLVFRNFNELLLPTLAIASAMIIIIILIRNTRLFLKTLSVLTKLPRLRKFGNSLTESYNSILILTSKKTLKIIWPFSILCWMTDALAVYFCFVAFDLKFDILETSLISLTSLILGAVSLLPGGLGVTEISMIGFLTNHKISLSLASALVLFIRLCTLWFSSFLGFLSLKKALSK